MIANGLNCGLLTGLILGIFLHAGISSPIYVPVTSVYDSIVSTISCTAISAIDWSVLTTSSCSLRSAWHLCHYLSHDSSYAGVDRCVIEISPELLGQTLAWNNSFGELSWYHPAIGLDNGLNSSISIEIHGNGVDIFGGNASMVVTRSSLDNSTVKWSEFPLMTSGLTANYAESVGTSIASAYICGGDSGYLLEFSSCKANGGSVSGDTYFWLYEDSVLVEENDDYCSLGSYISFAIPPHSPCKEYTLEVECHYSTSGSCSAKVQLNVYKLPNASRFIGFYNNATSTDQQAVTLLDSSTHLVIKNMTLTGFGASYLDGGVIYVENGLSLVVENCTFSDNEGRNGGALYKILSSSTDSTGNLDTVRLRSCTINDNSAGYMGGALAVTRESYLPPVTSSIETVVVSECLWSNNHAGSGGALALGMFVSDVSITDCDFIANTAYYGGSVYVHENNTGLILISLSFTNDYALSTGGSIRIEQYNQDITASDLSFSGCSAGILGGSISVGNGNSDMEISGVVVTNSVANMGGAMAFEVANENVRLSNHQLTNCKSSTGPGGGYYFRRSNHGIFLTNISLFNPTATTNGGGIYMYKENTNFIVENVFVNNSVSGSSGVVVYVGTTNQHLVFRNVECHKSNSGSNGVFNINVLNVNVTIANLWMKNIIANAGAVNIGNSNSYINIVNATIIKSVVGNRAGGVHIQSSNSYVYVKNVFVYDSSAVVQGGGLHIHSGNSHITIENFHAYRCSALDGGAVSLFQSNYDVQFINCHFEANTATFDGGAVQVQIYNNLVNFIGCNFTDNTAQQGGAMHVASDNKYVSLMGGTQKPMIVETEHPYVSYAAVNGVRYNILTKSLSIPGASGYLVFFDLESSMNVVETFGVYKDSTKAVQYYLRDFSVRSREGLYWPGTYIAPLRISSTTLYFEFLGTSSSANTQSNSLYGFKAYIYPIYNSDSVVPTIMSGNVATSKGGAFSMSQNNRYGVLVNTNIVDNVAAGSGGGLTMNTINGLISMHRMKITGNRALSGGGGGLEILYSQFGMSVSETSISNNVCAGSGGGAYIDSGNGAGLMVSGNEIAFELVTINNNTAGVNGGGVSIQERNTVTMKQSSFEDNKCTGNSCNGGGVNLYSQNTLTMTSTTIERNSAHGVGGGFAALQGNTVTLNAVDIKENNASISGGAIYGSTSTTMSLQGNMTWSDNEAGIGGGLSLSSSSIWSFGTKAGLVLSRNKAVKGSAMFLSDVTSTLNSVGSSWTMNITDNEASDGGTVFWYYNDVMSSEPSFLSSSRIAWSFNQALYGVRAATQTTNITVPNTYHVTAYSKALYPPLDVKFFDFYAQRIGNISSKTVQVAIVDFVNNSCSFSGLSGTSVTEGGVKVINGAAVFDDLSARCDPAGSLNIAFTATVDDLNTVRGGETYRLMEKTQLKFRDCVAGEYIEEGECVPCGNYTYKLTSDSSEQCTACAGIEGVETCYGKEIVLKKGYYRRSPLHSAVIPCLWGEANCVGGTATGLDLCAAGYQSELCATCEDGYFNDGYGCKQCETHNYFTLTTIVFITIVGVLVVIVLPLFALRYARWFLDIEGQQGDQKMMLWWQEFLTKAKLVVATFQIVASAIDILQVAFPSVFVTFVRAISVINPQIFTLFSAVQCTNSIHFFNRLLWATMTPLIFVVFLIIICVIHICWFRMSYRRQQALLRKKSLRMNVIAGVGADAGEISDLDEDEEACDYRNKRRTESQRHRSPRSKRELGSAVSNNSTLYTSICSTSSGESFLDEQVNDIRSKYINIALIVSYLILPNVSIMIFKTFLCTDVDPYNEDKYHEDYFLTADMSMSCQTEYYNRWVLYASLMILIYPFGIPCLYLYMLYRHRKIIKNIDLFMNNGERIRSTDQLGLSLNNHDPTSEIVAVQGQHQDGRPISPIATSSKSIVKIDANDPLEDEEETKRLFKQANRIRFLWNSYEPQFWYWEVIESYRRIIFTAVLSVIYPGTSIQSMLGMILAVICIRLYGIYRPYVEDSDDAIAELSQFQIFFVFLAGLAIKYDLVRNDWNTGIGITLVVTNLTIIFYAIAKYVREVKDINHMKRYVVAKSKHKHRKHKKSKDQSTDSGSGDPADNVPEPELILNANRSADLGDYNLNKPGGFLSSLYSKFPKASSGKSSPKHAVSNQMPEDDDSKVDDDGNRNVPQYASSNDPNPQIPHQESIKSAGSSSKQPKRKSNNNRDHSPPSPPPRPLQYSKSQSASIDKIEKADPSLPIDSPNQRGSFDSGRSRNKSIRPPPININTSNNSSPSSMYPQNTPTLPGVQAPAPSVGGSPSSRRQPVQYGSGRNIQSTLGPSNFLPQYNINTMNNSPTIPYMMNNQPSPTKPTSRKVPQMQYQPQPSQRHTPSPPSNHYNYPPSANPNQAQLQRSFDNSQIAPQNDPMRVWESDYWNTQR